MVIVFDKESCEFQGGGFSVADAQAFADRLNTSLKTDRYVVMAEADEFYTELQDPVFPVIPENLLGKGRIALGGTGEYRTFCPSNGNDYQCFGNDLNAALEAAYNESFPNGDSVDVLYRLGTVGLID